MTVMWPGQKNGRIPKHLMVDVGGGKLMQPAAAASWNRMVADAEAATGGTVYIASWQDAYRSIARQIMFWLLHLSGKGNLAARPGFSNHGWGLAADVIYSNAAVRAWMFANAHKYGWLKDPTEDWHWNYVGSLTTTTGNTSVTLTEADNSDMKLATVKYQDGTFHPFLIAAGSYSELGRETLAAWRNGKKKNEGPLGSEYSWSGADWSRVRRSLTELPPAVDASTSGLSAEDISDALADRFDAIPGEVVDEFAERLKD